MRCLIGILFVIASLSPAVAQVQFTVSQTLNLSSPAPATLLGEHLKLVDVTGDGDRDLLIVDAGSLRTYELQSSGAFTEIAAAPLPIVGTLAAVADFNNDGNLDALVRLLNGYSCLLGDGTGSFTQSGLYQTLADAGQAVVGDFNGDNLLDVAVTRGFGTPFLGYTVEINIRMGNGAGGFGAPIFSDFATTGLLNHTVVMDLDENGTDDLLLSSLEQLSFVFVANGLVSNVNFYPVGINDTPRDFQIQDLNNDGHDDIAFTCTGNSIVGIFLQDGSGNIGAFSSYAVNGSTFTVRAEDITGDSIPDLLTTSNIGLEWRHGVGDGTFGAASSMPLTTPDSRCTVGDSTSDGLAEVAVLSSNTVSILLNTSTAGEFIRGDVDLNGSVQLTDAVYTLQALFVPSAPAIACADSGDTNDDGVLNLNDAVYLLNYLFVPASPAPLAPGVSVCGTDPTADSFVDCGVLGNCP
ncbi:MAG: FG-GAP-like repeat-containing protein [Planctomycetota bacterium]